MAKRVVIIVRTTIVKVVAEIDCVKSQDYSLE